MLLVARSLGIDVSDKYAANWRGARKYQFDEEARLKLRARRWRSLKPWLVGGAVLCAVGFLIAFLAPIS